MNLRRARFKRHCFQILYPKGIQTKPWAKLGYRFALATWDEEGIALPPDAA